MGVALFALLLTQAMLLARVARKREWIIAGYLLLAEYSALTYTPFAPGWWTTHWLWLEPILMLARTLVTIRMLRDMPVVVSIIGMCVAVAVEALYGLSLHASSAVRTAEAFRTYWIMFLFVTLGAALIAYGLKTGRVRLAGVWWALTLLSYTVPAMLDWWLDRAPSPYNRDRATWITIATVAISARVLICLGWSLTVDEQLNHYQHPKQQQESRGLA